MVNKILKHNQAIYDVFLGCLARDEYKDARWFTTQLRRDGRDEEGCYFFYTNLMYEIYRDARERYEENLRFTNHNFNKHGGRHEDIKDVRLKRGRKGSLIALAEAQDL